jgi:hypothetical protein
LKGVLSAADGTTTCLEDPTTNPIRRRDAGYACAYFFCRVFPPFRLLPLVSMDVSPAWHSCERVQATMQIGHANCDSSDLLNLN